jgi:hypothetical protein
MAVSKSTGIRKTWMMTDSEKDIAYSYSHALGVAMCCYEYEDEDSAWWIQGLSIEDSFKMHVEAWCDLDVYI